MSTQLNSHSECLHIVAKYSGSMTNSRFCRSTFCIRTSAELEGCELHPQWPTFWLVGQSPHKNCSPQDATSKLLSEHPALLTTHKTVQFGRLCQNKHILTHFGLFVWKQKKLNISLEDFLFFWLEGKRSLFPCWCTSKLCKSSSCRNPCSEIHIEKLGLWICFLACPELEDFYKTGLVENQVWQVWSKAKKQPRAHPALDFGIPFMPLQFASLLLYVFVYLWWADLGWCPPSCSLTSFPQQNRKRKYDEKSSWVKVRTGR